MILHKNHHNKLRLNTHMTYDIESTFAFDLLNFKNYVKILVLFN